VTYNFDADIAQEYCDAAGKFCCFLENLMASDYRNYDALLRFLTEMYALSLGLPEVEPEKNNVMKRQPTKVSNLFGKKDVYWEIANPFEPEEPVCGTLSEDLASIYDDLRHGSDLLIRGHLNEALWHWRFSFRNHWSYHAVDALRVLNQLAMDG